MTEDKPVVFNVTSNFGHRTQQPFVMVAVNGSDFMAQMSPAEARDLAMNLLMCADASEGDAFLITFLRQRVGADNEAVAAILQEFREWRAGREPTP